MTTNDDKKLKKPATDTAPPKEKAPGEPAPKDKVAPEAKREPPGSSNYSRGEGQKPVSRAYKDNWNAIYAKKGKR